MKRRIIIAAPIVLAYLVAVVVFFPSERRGLVPIVYGRDACAHCRMVISQPGFAGEIRDVSGQISKFDDVGCMLISIAGAGRETPEAWVEDFDAKTFVPLLKATLVRGALDTPMGHGIVAFEDPAKAEAFAAQKNATVVKLDDLFVELKGGSFAKAQTKPFTMFEAEQGRALFGRECSACHGTMGAGDGPASAFLDPRPRDFTKKTFKFRTTESGKPPLTEDVLATLERGLPGSAMPSFAFLPIEDRRKVGAYVFKAAGLLGKPEPAAFPDPGETPDLAATASLERGKALFQSQGCVACHGETGKGDGTSAPTLVDNVGRPIRPRDFTTGVFRGGAEPRDVYYRIFAGIDGTPMPAFAETVPDKADRWALVAYVKSLAAPTPLELPSDPILAGRMVAEKYGCGGCHVLDNGKGGEVGPAYKLAGKKLQPEWIRSFLQDPRAKGKIYPWRIHRMPGVQLDEPEIEAMVAYLGAVGKFKASADTNPSPASFPDKKLADGKNVFVLRCSQCHALGSIVKTPLASQQGPDLANVAGRLDYSWMKGWILDPRSFDPKSKMTVPGITPDEADAVRMFIWKMSLEEQKVPAGGIGGAP